MDAVNSVKKHPDPDAYEIIIVNDGSTDVSTMDLLYFLESNGHKVIHQENKGPAAARNVGAYAARGEYLLFLDSDNMIRPAYLDKALDAFRKDSCIGVVYGNPRFFGEQEDPRFTSGIFDLRRMLFGNYIDMCAAVRKKVWKDLGGLDESRVLIGHEDWEFWIRAGVCGIKFHYIDEVLFDYRIVKDSLVKSASKPERYRDMQTYVYEKHLKSLVDGYRSLYNQYTFYQNDLRRPFRTFLKAFYYKYIRRGVNP